MGVHQMAMFAGDMTHGDPWVCYKGEDASGCGIDPYRAMGQET